MTWCSCAHHSGPCALACCEHGNENTPERSETLNKNGTCLERRSTEASLLIGGLTSVGQPGNHDSAACSGGDHEARFNDGNDGQALGLGDHMGCKETHR